MFYDVKSVSHVVWARMTGVASGGRPSICFHILGWHFFLRDLPPASGRGMPKKLVQLLRLNTLNIGTLISRTTTSTSMAKGLEERKELFYNGNQAQNGVLIAEQCG